MLTVNSLRLIQNTRDYHGPLIKLKVFPIETWQKSKSRLTTGFSLNLDFLTTHPPGKVSKKQVTVIYPKQKLLVYIRRFWNMFRNQPRPKKTSAGSKKGTKTIQSKTPRIWYLHRLRSSFIKCLQQKVHLHIDKRLRDFHIGFLGPHNTPFKMEQNYKDMNTTPVERSWEEKIGTKTSIII